VHLFSLRFNAFDSKDAGIGNMLPLSVQAKIDFRVFADRQ